MIRKLLRRVFLRGESAKRQAERIPASRHGIRREQVSTGARRTCEALQKGGFKAYVVGGAVRDLIAGIPPKDYDIATDATPEQVRGLFRRSRIIGRRFQIVHVMQGPETLEVSTFRAAHDEDTLKDEHGRVLRNNVWGSIEEDAARRDFTMNALYYDPTEEVVLDFHHGVDDIQRKTLRMIGDPRARYREDPVRMLRAVRLAAKLGFEIHATARAPFAELGVLLAEAAPARLFDESLKMFLGGHGEASFRELEHSGLMPFVFPATATALAQDRDGRAHALIAAGLANTDARIEADKSVTPAFLFALLLWEPVFPGISTPVLGTVALWVAALLTLWSMFHYLRLAAPHLVDTSDAETPIDRKGTKKL